MYIKICGITSLHDARVALEAGADLLGFNFYRPSPRYVAPALAAEIIARVRAEFAERPFLCVGVFVNAPLADAQDIQRTCALDLLQLHGDESADYCATLGARAFKALRANSSAETMMLVERYAPSLCQNDDCAPHFLLDAAHPQLYGGTGETGDWTTAREIAAQYRILLAGGLTPTNVADAIRAVRPWGVDVASGVERAPGVKDAEKVRRFIESARQDP